MKAVTLPKNLTTGIVAKPGVMEAAAESVNRYHQAMSRIALVSSTTLPLQINDILATRLTDFTKSFKAILPL